MSTSTRKNPCRLRIGLIALLLALAAPLPVLAQCAAATPAAKATAIANGHAFGAHQHEFVQGHMIAGLAFPYATIANPAQFATFIQGIMTGTSPSRALNHNRRAYWNARTGTVVIVNPGAADCGTAFRPNAGMIYYNNLN